MVVCPFSLSLVLLPFLTVSVDLFHVFWGTYSQYFVPFLPISQVFLKGCIFILLLLGYRRTSESQGLNLAWRNSLLFML